MEGGAVGHNFERDPPRFGLIWFSGFRGEDLNVNFDGMVLGWPPSKIVSGDPDFQPRWPSS
jgi:hypothetical protein